MLSQRQASDTLERNKPPVQGVAEQSVLKVLSYIIKYRKIIIILLLLLLTVAGGRSWLSELRDAGPAFWRERLSILISVALLQSCDIFLDGFIWWYLLRAAGIRVPAGKTVLLFLSGYAGLLAPVQLGRLIRPIELKRLGNVPLGAGVLVEILLLGFSAVAGVVVLCGALLWPRLGWGAVAAALLALGCAAWVCRFTVLPDILTGLKGVIKWHHPALAAAVFLTPIGWLINGLSLWLVSGPRGSGVPLWELFAVAPSNMIVGALSGMPGGIGAVEAWLGGMLSLLGNNAATLVNEVLLFRLMTFWIWIPIGWLALFVLWRFPDGSLKVLCDERT